MLLTRFSFLLLVLSRFSFAQSSSEASALLAAISQLPPCAITCLTTAIADSTCQPTDATCICANKQLLGSVENCVMQTCTLRQMLTTKNITSTTCHAPIRSQVKTLRVTNITMGVVSAASVIARLLYKAVFSVAELGWDDYLIVATLLVGIPQTIITDLGTTPNGIGRDVWTVSFHQITEFGRFFYVMEVLYFSVLTLLKLTLLVFFLRIFPAQRVRRILWGTIIFTACWGIATTLAAILQCKPIRYNWTRWDNEHEGQCLNINALAWSNAGISIALDIWMLVIPLWQVFKLKMSWRKKISVSLMFLVGAFVTAMSIVRLQSLITFAKSQNPTWDQAGVSQWSTIEINVGIVCACMPALRKILVRLFPSVLGTTSTAESKYYVKYGHPSGKSGNTSSAVGSRLSGMHPISADRDRNGVNGITYTKTFEVQHGDDEEQLMRMDDLSSKGTKVRSSNSSDVSVSGATSPLPTHPTVP
ncbi:hypothetical protein P280DRAFT_409992 [Massarina eburnea CBS 473.64]|uniref:CFEM domain-containing protein n=1 Tax=Massarina eburnea CBS 473.64 TaxID=1395130 RepID=A0A6A6RLY8_9PLEO|nr:hypothetical protein P280DRAFT_409992 [Massarina eburnea CBS 473.64]